MTVKSRLLISHLIMFIVPIFMTVIVAAVMPAGAPTLSRGNNYLYLENISKCTRFPSCPQSRILFSSPKEKIPFTSTETKTICRRLREQLDIPILIVSARRDDIDKIRSLGFGADDYIEKPFSPAVLAARVKSQLARYEQLKGTAKENTGIITIGDITLNPSTRIVTVRGENKLLPNKEFQLLEFLMINADIV